MSGDELLAKLTFTEMGTRYCNACDAKDWDAALSLFAEDAEIDATAVYGKAFKGHEQIRTFFSSAPDCLGHHATGFYSDMISDSKAIGHLKMLTMFKRNTFTVNYRWDLEKIEGKWLIKKQKFKIFAKQDFVAS
ncbi:MAG: nuclear transport factor 2 family protein [Pseudomonadales bacterium]|nr:nuclear transport factor 2 family protein [Pseudomonadales bacterium]MDG2078319.1 nuclear transport factor 2 family protein [Pseudomonadales bacterium]